MISYLLDTTYILPFFGIQVNVPRLEEFLEKLKSPDTSMEHNYIISACSLIEAKWKAIRMYIQSQDATYLDYANIALESFKTNRYFEIVESWYNIEACKYADELLIHGHKDYIDCWIAGTAREKGATLVTEDGNLKDFVANISEWKNFKIYSWQEFLAEINFLS